MKGFNSNTCDFLLMCIMLNTCVSDSELWILQLLLTVTGVHFEN